MLSIYIRKCFYAVAKRLLKLKKGVIAIIKKFIYIILLFAIMLLSGCTDREKSAAIPDNSKFESTDVSDTSKLENTEASNNSKSEGTNVSDNSSQSSEKNNIFTLSDDRETIKKYSSTGELIQTYTATGVYMISHVIADYSNNIVYYTGHDPDSEPDKNIFTLFMMDVSSEQKEPVALVNGIEARIYMQGSNLYYWVNGDGIYKYDTKTGNTKRIAPITKNIYDYIINENFLYYSIDSYEKRELSGLYSYRLADNTNEKLVSWDGVGIIGLIEDGCIYSFYDNGQKLLYHYDRTTGKSTLISPKATFCVTYEDKILYVNPDDNYHIYQMDSNGNNSISIIPKHGSDLQISNGWLYIVGSGYSDYRNYFRYNLETGVIETLPESFSGKIIGSNE
ncbi:DUF5050 domain-containing protein [Clostridium thermosuccinogenes]|uniref:DUF5050 domain-containing protein n=1 Tax=Clostridium thermosuccinogenes TaxID=84032 RepID=UPI000CA32CA7|nr:DUF5050 domain-containing protein [Pseudoclostridium thermosuccinogenes]AUS98018.1 hypothetical protein CDO33_17125 [Pseudoclostridium thermosuccinogenes]PNT91886.1 hypothetical protein CDQ85_18455 [Pseudoclostridium thermosuccinogenes]